MCAQAPPRHGITEETHRFLLTVTFRVTRRLGVPVVAEFTCPDPRLPRAAGSPRSAALGVVAQQVHPSVVSRDYRCGHCRAHLRRPIACSHLLRFGAV
ncbi:DUF5914 domain-containing protein [Nocardia beijingensis]